MTRKTCCGCWARQASRLPSGIDLAKRLLAQLPDTNGLARNPAIGDYRRGEDAGLVDLLLHARDRAYRVG